MAFALETTIDEVAAELHLDPIEIRRRNLAPAGAPMVDGERWAAHGAAEVLDALEATAAWRDRANVGADEGAGGALGHWPGATNPASAACRGRPDGSVRALTGAAAMSGGGGG